MKKLLVLLFILIIGTFLSACQLVVDPCDPEGSLPYSKNDLIYEPHCSSKKCCEFIVNEEPSDSMTKICHEMWCFRDCTWTMNHRTCY